MSKLPRDYTACTAMFCENEMCQRHPVNVDQDNPRQAWADLLSICDWYKDNVIPVVGESK